MEIPASHLRHMFGFIHLFIHNLFLFWIVV